MGIRHWASGTFPLAGLCDRSLLAGCYLCLVWGAVFVAVKGRENLPFTL
ncbi:MULTISPECIES: hypothetical protein [unclassified Nostoc]|nr:hypothetical protein [Nostoc sp. S13]MDF5736785.1 hypothetical protein [Nostoc sp. S13]